VLLIAIISYIIFILLAAVDSLYWHFIKLKLYQYHDTRKEHIFHTVRNILMLALSLFLFNASFENYFLDISLVVIGIDIILLVLDLLVESKARIRFGGISKWEYVIHVMANGFYFLAVFTFLQLKYLKSNILKSDEYSAFFDFWSPLISVVIALSLVLHLYLHFKYRTNEQE